MKIKKTFNVLLAVASLCSTSVPALANEMDDLKKQVADLNSRMSELEIKDSMNTFKWSGVLNNRFDYFENKHSAEGTPKEMDLLRVYSTQFSLNGEARVTDRVNFFMTVGMSKFWNNDGRSEPYSHWVRSMTGSYSNSGSTPMIDRAYFNYKFDLPLTFSIGRMSTNMGPPIEQMDGLARQGTYPRFAYNAIFDGMALTYDFSKMLPKDHSLSVRVFYTPFVNINDQDRTIQAKDSSGQKIEASNPQFTVLTEYSLKNLSWAEKLSLTHFYYDYRHFYWEGEGYTTPVSDGHYWDGQAQMIFIGLDGIAHTGLNVSFSHLRVDSKAVNSPGSSALVSNAYLATANYRFSSLGQMIVGGEYIQTDPNFYLDEWTYQNLIPFYKAGDSKGTHFFVSKPLGDNLTLRVGRYRLDTKSYVNRSSGAPVYESANMDSYYANLRLDF